MIFQGVLKGGEWNPTGTPVPVTGRLQRQTRWFPRLSMACSGLLLLAGTYGLLERTIWP
jgi:hypothetical protein